MKRLLLSLFICSAFTASRAQIILEHSYDGTTQMNAVTLEGEGDKYYLWDTASKTVKLFNTDHSLWKTITPPVPTGRRFYIMFIPSTKLFDNDNGVELLFSVSEKNGPGLNLWVLNEDGSILLDVQDAYYATLKKVAGSWKMITNAGNSHKVYGLPGSLPQQSTGFKPGAKGETTSSIYPNPVDEAAVITYTLPEGIAQADLKIYSSNGQVVKNMTVTNHFNSIVFQPGDLPAGVYFYEVGGKKQRFVIR